MQNKRYFQWPFIVQGKCNASIETNPFSNALAASPNETGTTQEIEEKSLRSIDIGHLEKFVLV